MCECQFHAPVLLDEVMTALCPKPGEVFVDCTLGAGGHSAEILKKIMPDGFLIGIDRDDKAIKIAKDKLAEFKDNFVIFKDNYKNMGNCLKKIKREKVDGILVDLGFSSMQIDDAERGFSFNNKGPLDMRMDQSQKITAEDIVNHYSEKKIADIIYEYGEERGSRRIAKDIVHERKRNRIKDTSQLENIIFKAVGRRGSKKSRIPKTHPATKAFQALRIVVNDELSSLHDFVQSVMSFLNDDGRICFLSYHSLEDRIVKNAFKEFYANQMGRIYNKKPICPEIEEINKNNRARSAKMRVFTRERGNDA